MPEYLAPGVYVEEVSFRSKSIEGVPTTTTAFVGPTRTGPVTGDLEVLTSLAAFERIYGDGSPLVFRQGPGTGADTPGAPEGVTVPNDMWHAARAFFANGGTRLYVKRIFADRPPGVGPGEQAETPDESAAAGSAAAGSAGAGSAGAGSQPPVPFGRAWHAIDGSGYPALVVSARFPGAGERTVSVSVDASSDVLVETAHGRRLVGVQDGDIVLVAESVPSGAGSVSTGSVSTGSVSTGSVSTGSVSTGTVWTGRAYKAVVGFDGSVRLELPHRGDPPFAPPPRTLDELGADAVVRILTLTVTVRPPGQDAAEQVWSGLPIDPAHERNGRRDSVFALFAETPAARSDALGLPIVVTTHERMNGVEVLEAVGRKLPGLLAGLAEDPPRRPVLTLSLTGGSDGWRPGPGHYEGGRSPADEPLGLTAFEEIEDVSIVAAPGSSRDYASRPAEVAAVQQALITHCRLMRYRIAVLDCGDGLTVAQVRRMRAGIDSSHAAFYYPWVVVVDPVTQREIALPPSGFVAGIYARNDIERAVYKAPANEVVQLATGFERLLTKGEQDVLNPEGVNCFRSFPGRGLRLWGARTATSDPEWKYVNLRRYFAYLEHSVDRGTQWAVFEPNGERLWANVRRTVQDFLFAEWQSGALLGDRAEKAFFVACDRTTMTQNDLDNGRLVCLVGVAALRPAEFVIFRIGQWTADRTG